MVTTHFTILKMSKSKLTTPNEHNQPLNNKQITV